MSTSTTSPKPKLQRDLLFKDFEYEPHEAQITIQESKARIKIIIAGRRFGKSKSAAHECLYNLLKDANQRGWVVAPTYDLSKKVFRELWWLIHNRIPHWVVKSSERNQYIKLRNGSEIWGKSADNPVSLIGEGLHFLIMDEAARIPEMVWVEALRPTLADFRGTATFITTPKGKNWLYHLFVRGQSTDEKHKAYESWQFPTSSNPHIHSEEIEELRTQMHERAYQQEILAQFLDDSGSFFKGVRDCIKPGLEPKPINGHQYVIGYDLARIQDFGVMVCLDITDMRMVDFYRTNQTSWNFQYDQVERMAKKWNATVITDATGVGDPVYEELKNRGINAIAFKYTNKSKQAIMDNLALMIEHGNIILQDQPDLINELEIFEYQFNENTRTFKLNAPAGLHDDCVNALALAAWQGKITSRHHRVFDISGAFA